MEAPYPVLRAMTPEAQAALQHEKIVIRHLPFRVGRESRFRMVHGKLRSMERREGMAPPNNDVYLIDNEDLLNVSREHFQIEQGEEGAFVIVDRGSTCGTIVDGHTIGPDAPAAHSPLRNGSTITVGLPESPYVFAFHVGD